MGDDENEALLAEAKYDPAKMVELLEHHRGLVLRVVDHYRQHFGTHDVDDLVQLGLLGLVQAARSYDPTKPKAAWSTHATLFVRREIWNQAVRPSMKASRLHMVSFQSADTGQGDERSLDTRPWLAGSQDDDEEDWELDPFAATFLKAPRARPNKADGQRRIVSSSLTSRQKEVLLARLDGKTQQEIGPTQPAAADAERRALKKLTANDRP